MKTYVGRFKSFKIGDNEQERLPWSYSGGPMFDAPLEKAAPSSTD